MSKLDTRGRRGYQRGHKIARRGIAKKKKGIGLNITGKGRRSWKPNMQKKKIRFSDGTVRRMWVRVRDLKSGIYDNPDPSLFRKGKPDA